MAWTETAALVFLKAMSECYVNLRYSEHVVHSIPFQPNPHTLFVTPLPLLSSLLLQSSSRHLLPNHERGPLVAEVGDIAEDLVGLGAEGVLEVLDRVEVEGGLDGVGALGVGIGRADELEDRVAPEVVGPKLLGHHRHVRLEVVVHVEGRVGLVGVEDCDLDVCHFGGGGSLGVMLVVVGCGWTGGWGVS